MLTILRNSGEALRWPAASTALVASFTESAFPESAFERRDRTRLVSRASSGCSATRATRRLNLAAQQRRQDLRQVPFESSPTWGFGSRRRSSVRRPLPRGPRPSTPICRSPTTPCPTSPEAALLGSLAPERGFACVIQASAGKMRHNVERFFFDSLDQMLIARRNASFTVWMAWLASSGSPTA